nr:MAG: hypothetical protein DIU78_12275 [Pseudomonadota bacterium]
MASSFFHPASLSPRLSDDCGSSGNGAPLCGKLATAALHTAGAARSSSLPRSASRRNAMQEAFLLPP